MFPPHLSLASVFLIVAIRMVIYPIHPTILFFSFTPKMNNKKSPE